MSLTPFLNVENVRVRYDTKVVLDGVSLQIATPGLVALLGPNGSGKTTLLRALLGLVPFDGAIRWRGDDAIVRRPTDLARAAAYLPQSPAALTDQRVGETILTGRFAHRGAFDFLDRTGDVGIVTAIARDVGLDALLDARVDQLSGGQRQRVFLARCLAQQTPVLLLDEPATFLDLRHQLELHRLLHRLAREQNKTILMACHDLNLAATHADRMIVLDAGKIVADGPPGEVMDPALIERVYGVPMRRVEVDGHAHLVPRV